MITASSVHMDHVPTLEGAWNYHECAKLMKMTLIRDGLWTFVTSNTDSSKEEEVGTWKPNTKTSSLDVATLETAHCEFASGNSRANAVIRRKLTTLAIEILCSGVRSEDEREKRMIV